MSESRTTCRICHSSEIRPVLSLGTTPLADGCVAKNSWAIPNRCFRSMWLSARSCSLVQLLETVPPEELFCQDYPYYSSFSPALLQHSRDNALDLIESRKLSAEQPGDRAGQQRRVSAEELR